MWIAGKPTYKWWQHFYVSFTATRKKEFVCLSGRFSSENPFGWNCLAKFATGGVARYEPSSSVVIMINENAVVYDLISIQPAGCLLSAIRKVLITQYAAARPGGGTVAIYHFHRFITGPLRFTCWSFATTSRITRKFGYFFPYFSPFLFTKLCHPVDRSFRVTINRYRVPNE